MYKEKLIVNTNNTGINIKDFFENEKNYKFCKRTIEEYWTTYKKFLYSWYCYSKNTPDEIFLFPDNFIVNKDDKYIIIRWNENWNTQYKNEIIYSWIIYINHIQVIWSYSYDWSWKVLKPLKVE